MALEDQEKTVFQTPEGLLCYIVIAFGLRNLGATYQTMVNQLFKDLLWIAIETYVDDILMKSKYQNLPPEDLRRCFEIMDKFNLRLNPKKCTFTVLIGKFLGFMMTGRVIEPNPKKVKEISKMQLPRLVKDVQKLTGSLATLSRFLSKSVEKSIVFPNFKEI